MQRSVRKPGFLYVALLACICDWLMVHGLSLVDPDGLYKSILLLVVSAKLATSIPVGLKLSAIVAVCKNSIDNDDPRCMNGGYLRAQNTTEQSNCAVCECPAGWGGVDCSGRLAISTLRQCTAV